MQRRKLDAKPVMLEFEVRVRVAVLISGCVHTCEGVCTCLHVLQAEEFCVDGMMHVLHRGVLC